MHQSLHVVGPFGVEEHLLSCDGVDEAERLGVEHLARTELEAVVDELAVLGCIGPFEYLVASVSLIAEKGVAEMAHVGAYLVGASCLEHTFDKGGVAEAL